MEQETQQYNFLVYAPHGVTAPLLTLLPEILMDLQQTIFRM